MSTDEAKPIRIRETGSCAGHTHCERLAVLERSHADMKTAFVQNDLGLPDYDGTRKARLKQIEAEKIVEGYKVSAATKVIGIVIAAITALMYTGVLSKIGGH